MTESQVVNQGINMGELGALRKNLIRLLTVRFPEQISKEIIQIVNDQVSMALLDEWFAAAATTASFDDFLAVLKR